jgi:hypothetical protein
VFLRRQMRVHAIKWIAILLSLGFLFGCSEDKGIEPKDIVPLAKNHSPVIVAQPDTFATVGDTLRLQIAAFDQDGDSLYFGQEVPCTWGEIKAGQCHSPIAHIDSRTGSFWFYPRTYDVPERHVVVTVSDEHGASAYMEFVVSVSIGQE